MESYDDLPSLEQAAVRAEWDHRVAAILAELDLTDAFRAAGRPWAEADEDGKLLMHRAAPPPR
jgi:hypothetical protein